MSASIYGLSAAVEAIIRKFPSQERDDIRGECWIVLSTGGDPVNKAKRLWDEYCRDRKGRVQLSAVELTENEEISGRPIFQPTRSKKHKPAFAAPRDTGKHTQQDAAA